MSAIVSRPAANRSSTAVGSNFTFVAVGKRQGSFPVRGEDGERNKTFLPREKAVFPRGDKLPGSRSDELEALIPDTVDETVTAMQSDPESPKVGKLEEPGADTERRKDDEDVAEDEDEDVAEDEDDAAASEGEDGASLIENVAGQFVRQNTTVLYVSDKFSRLPMDEFKAFKVGTYEAMQTFRGGNIGNYVWQYGAFRQLPVFHPTLTCTESRNVCLRYARVQNASLVEYRPVANYLKMSHEHPGTRFSYVTSSLKRGMATLFVGIGLDMPFRKNASECDLNPTLRVETTVDDFTVSEAGQAVLDGLQKVKFPMLTRGDMTRDVCRKNGYEYAISNGCPSLMISENVRLGETLEPKYRALKDRIRDTSLKVAINFKSTPRYFAMVWTILKKYPNSYIYTQGMQDFSSLRKQGFPIERVRFFPNVFEWQESLRQMDVSFGGRIHGNMIALAVEVPVFVIAPDHRVLELVEKMLIPHNTVFSADLDPEKVDVADVVSRYEFDGRAFDQNRCEIAKTYREVFGRYGVGVRGHVKAISELC